MKSSFLHITVHCLCIAFEDNLELDISISLFAFHLLSHLNSQNIHLEWQILETVEYTCIWNQSLTEDVTNKIGHNFKYFLPVNI